MAARFGRLPCALISEGMRKPHHVTLGVTMRHIDWVLWVVCFILALMPGFIVASLPLIYPHTYR